jgi:hypothetical protein
LLFLAGAEGVEPPTTLLERVILPLNYAPILAQIISDKKNPGGYPGSILFGFFVNRLGLTDLAELLEG